MKGVLIMLAILIIIGWGIGYFGYHVGGFFHLTLAVAVIAIVLQLIPNPEK